MFIPFVITEITSLMENVENEIRSRTPAIILGFCRPKTK